MSRFGQRSGAWALGLAALAVAAVLRNGVTDYVVDNRFEQYWNPGRRIGRGLTLWDASRGMGRVREELWPGATIPIGVFRFLGASPAVAEHLWHAALLTAAGTGMVALLRRYRPVLGVEHLLAALAYMFGPYAATFLVPSNLFFHYALTPWLAVVAHRGLHGGRPWRWASVFALLVFSAGNLDTPGLLYGGLAVALVVLHEVALDGGVSVRRAAGWLLQAGFLTALVSSAALAKTAIGVDAFSRRLESTETPEVIAATSSWSESFRGMGFWLSYFRDTVDHVRPEGAPFFTNPWLIAATFAPVVVGLGALWWARRWRHRTLFLAMLVLGTFLMVGGYPADDPPPWGRAWLWAVREVPVVGTLRTTYKAGAVAGLGAAALFGMAIVTAGRVLGAEPRRRLGVLGLGAVVVVAAAAPFWSGGLYGAERRLDEVPSYWRDAMSWLDAQPGDGQVLFLPGATRSVYRWGWPGDDIQDALMDRAHLTDTAVSLSRPLVADVLEALDDAAVDGAHAPGSIAPVLRRLGISYVVLRNDLEWQRMGVARPAQYSQLRHDPDLTVAATFGRPGQNTGGGAGPVAELERDLAPIEVLAVGGDVTRARAVPLGPWSLLEGSGAGWISMAAAGLLHDDQPIVPTALLDATTLSDALARGSSLVVTDSNRRRAQGLTAYTGDRSRILAADEDLGRSIPDLYGATVSQSVATYADAERIDDPGIFRTLGGFVPEYRPSQAFDGDLRTGWVVGPQPDHRNRSLHVELREPRVLDRVVIVAFDPRSPDRSADPTSSFTGVPRIGRAVIELSDGTKEFVNLITGRADLRLPARPTTSFELRILDVTEEANVGIAEISFPGQDLDLAEHVRLPDDAIRLATDSAPLRARLERAAVVYILDREIGRGALPVEGQLRRELRTLGSRSFAVEGSLTWRDDEPRPAVDASGCVDVGLVVDDMAIPVRLSGPDTTPRFAACSRVPLLDGWHRVAGTGQAVIDHLELRAPGPSAAAPAPSPELRVRATTATSRTLTVTAPDGGLVLPGDGYDARWRASMDGTELGAPVPADGQTAWVVPDGTGEAEVRVSFGPAGLFRGALVVSGVGVIACLVLIAWPRRRRLEEDPEVEDASIDEPTVEELLEPTELSPRAVGVLLIAELTFGCLVLGPIWGVVVTGGVALAIARLGPSEARRATAASAAGLLVIAAAATVLEVDPSRGWNLTYATARPVAAGAAAAAAALAMASTALAVGLAARRRTALPYDDQDQTDAIA